jgi:hypothetical protein
MPLSNYQKIVDEADDREITMPQSTISLQNELKAVTQQQAAAQSPKPQ